MPVLFTGVRPVFAKYRFSPVHCDIILSTIKLYTKNDITMYWREIVLGENWSYASTVSLNQNTFWIKPLYQWKIKTESVTVGSTILSHFNCANKMIYYYLLYCTHFIAGIHCQGIQKLQVTLKLPSTVIYLKHVSNIILIDSLQNFSPTIVF